MVLDVILPVLAQIITNPITNYVVAPIKRHIRYAFYSVSNLEKLQHEALQLKNQKDRLQQSVDHAARLGELIDDKVSRWLTRADEAIAEADQIIHDKEQVKAKCFIGLCPNLKIRYRLSRRADKKAAAVDKVRTEEGLDTISYRRAPKQIVAPSVYTREALHSRVSILNEIMDALKDPSLNIMGVYGMGGVGKTTLAKEVHRQAQTEKLFDVVLMVAISQTPDHRRIQKEIAEALGLDLVEEEMLMRANQLSRRLKTGKTLIILDDIWKQLQLEEVGIPFGDDCKGCKLLLTSRSHHVLSRQMRTQKDFKLEVLLEAEARSLFQMNVGDAQSPLGAEIAQKCGGLPLLILEVAMDLQNKDSYAWNDKLERLSVFGDQEIQAKVHSVLELSYNNLHSGELKSLFLLCGLFGQPHIPIQYLLMYSMGLGLFNRASVEDARSRLFTLITDLKDVCLLLDGDMDGFVKMHDVVRYTAMSIASREQNAFTSSSESEEWPDKDCTRISLPYDDIRELPEELECPKAELLFLFSEDFSLKIPDIFFKGISKLRVVDLTGIHLVSMPSSLSLLTNLQALCLHRGQLDNVTAIGELKQLEVLSFADSYIAELPRQIEQLTRLKLLDLSNCSKLEVIPANVLSKLTLLEALHLSNSFVGWEAEGNASLGELEQLSGLTNLEMQILNANMLPKSLFCNFYRLKHYRIVIGDGWDWRVNNEFSRTLKLRFKTSIHLERGVKMLLKETEDLYLDEVRGIKNVLYDLDGDGFPQLKHLHVQNDSLTLHIVMNSTMRSTCVAFPILQSLFLDSLMTLEDICHGQPVADSFSKLEILNVRNCERLTSLFSFSASEKEDVDKVGVVELTKIRSITLENLPQLKSVCYETKSDPASEAPASSEGDLGATFSLFNRLVSLPNLEDLQISSICCEKIWQDNLSLTSSKLTSLIIKQCNKLKHVFTTSMAKSLLHLKKLEIRGCDSVEEIIHTEESVQEEEAMPKIFFPKLDELMLYSLPNLIRFCTACFPVEFQSLRKLEIDSCNSLTTFIPFAAHAETMVSPEDELVNSKHELVNSEDEQANSEDEKVNSEDEQVNKMNKFEIQSLFNGMVGFFNLKEMRLVSLDNVENIWHSHLAPDSFCKLKALHVESCPKLLILFPWNVLPRFHGLDKLHLKHCSSVQEIFKFQDLNVREANDAVAFKLRELNICDLAELKFIWSMDPSTGFTFQELKLICVYLCNSLKNICPASVARGLLQLQCVSISKCEELEEIVTKIEGVQPDPDTFKFPQLTSLYLDSLPKIKSFYPGRYRAEWPKLKHLEVMNCNTKYKGAEVGGQGQRNIPFFFLEKVDVNALEELALHHNDLMVLQHIQFNTKCFSKLKVVKLQSLSKESCLFLFGFLKTLYKFVVDESSLEELFTDERIVGKKLNLGRLEHLEISQAHNLKRIWKQDVPFNPFIQYLHTLKINWCGRLENIVQSSSFKNLKALKVNHCENLKYLVTVSTANGLLQLTKMSIFSCKMMTEVVQNDGDQTEDEILFGKLKVLNLEDLSLLTSFCSGNCAFRFPVLEDVTVSCCSEMRIFSCGDLSAPKLRLVKKDKFSDEQYWEGDLNKTIESLSRGAAVYRGFQPSKNPAPRTQWHDKHLGGRFHNVRTLVVDKCEFFSKDMSPHLLRCLNKLRKLEVRDCSSVGELFDLEGMSIKKRVGGLLPRLSELHLLNLPMFRHLWNKDPYGISDFKNLKLLKIHNCGSLTYAFTQFMAVCLEQLQELQLTNCHMLEVIIKMDDEAEEELAYDNISFPRLSELHLVNLPMLRHLWNKDPYRISDIKNLKLLKFHNCSSLKYAFTQSMAVCLVQLQELELTSCHMLEVIIKMDDEAEEELADDSITFPRLSKLLLIDLPALTHLWN